MRAAPRTWLSACRAALPIAVPLAVGLVAWRTGHNAAALGAAAVAAIALVLTAFGVEVDRVATRLTAPVGRVLAAFLASVVWLGFLAVWIVCRLLGIEPLDAPSGGFASSWRRSAGPAEQDRAAARTFAIEPAIRPRPLRARTLARLAGVVLMAAGAVALALPAARAIHRAITPADQLGPQIAFPSFAFPHASWVAELHDAGWPVEYHPALGWQSQDVTSAYLNVHGGVRRSWEPTDPKRTVWFLGGSAMYGLGQRDSHTIASAVARLSVAAGDPVEAVNLGVVGYTQWQEVALMSYRLSHGERPDLIVIYDGANDLTGMEYRAQQGIVPLDEPPNRFHEQIEAETRFRPEPRSSPASEAQLRQAFLASYDAGVDLAIRTGAAYGIPVEVYWQPTFASSTPTGRDAALVRMFPDLSASDMQPERERVRAIEAGLDRRVVDLGAALDHAPSPTFFDPVHTNELGATLTARAMWRTLGTALRQLPPRPGG